MIDGLKLASLNTPNMLNNSLSVVGGLILGDYAVEAGWFSSQTILYMAIVAIASFTQQSYELGYAFKFLRILLLLAVAVFGLWGLLGGLLLTAILIACNRTVSGSRSYLYPLIPFNGKALARMFVRKRLK
jgi:stage V sporulation protein AF